MSTLIFRTMAPALFAIMMLLSLIVLLRGHNEPGGGFIGGLIASAAIALLGMAWGPERTRRALRVPPLAIAASGLMLAVLAGLAALPLGLPFLTGLWAPGKLVSTPMLFDTGVYLVVIGSLSAMALALEEGGRL